MVEELEDLSADHRHELSERDARSSSDTPAAPVVSLIHMQLGGSPRVCPNAGQREQVLEPHADQEVPAEAGPATRDTYTKAEGEPGLARLRQL
jgi:hypothetical protein